jgi:AraC family transcriptional regulator
MNPTLRYGEFFGREINRIDAPGFIVTFRRSTSGQRDAERHAHSHANVLVPFDRGYWSEADRFDESSPVQVVYTPPGMAHNDSMVRLGGRYLAISIDHGLTEHPFPIALNRPLAMRFAHQLALWSISGQRDVLMVEDACLALLGELDAHDRSHAASTPTWCRDVIDICHGAPARPLTIAAIAGMVGVHPVHVSRVFQRYYGVPLSRYVASVRVEHAAALLRGSRQPAAAIAIDCGFHDHSHLCKTFRAALGVTPSQYRERFVAIR